MDFGVVLQTDPPASRLLELTSHVTGRGFAHAWTFGGHLLWQKPFVIFSRMLHENPDLIVGPMVTNPGTRDWTVLPSLFATLDNMYFAHGPDHDAWLKATTGDLVPENLAGTMAFMFETRFPLIPTA